MKFSIITPTYKRAEKLQRAINSVLAQSRQDWEMIIVNDSPGDESYSKISTALNDIRIKYLVNDANRGANFSRNRALDAIAPDSDWIIFLDDDDFLAQNALTTHADIIRENPNQRWIITNRAYKDGSPITQAPKNRAIYSYARDYLIKKIIKNDATHCIKTELIKNIRFPSLIKQGEEWLFFFQIKNPIFYCDINTTLSDGYDKTHGLNFRKRSAMEQLRALILIIKEGRKFNILTFYFFLYICMRLMRAIIK